MQAKTSDKAQKIVVLGTGGTIAGLSTPEKGAGAYVAGQTPIEDLLAGVVAPGFLAEFRIQSEQVAQVDSKDMGLSVWQALLRRCRHWLTQADVRGVLITHGTDTLEETAWLLQQLLEPILLDTGKPLVLTCAMRPADAPDADGPGNLRDALRVLVDPGAAGRVLTVCAGRVLRARDVQKVHATRLDAFRSGEQPDAGAVLAPLAKVASSALGQATVRWSPQGDAIGSAPAAQRAHAPDHLLEEVLAVDALPRVEILWSHAAAGGTVVDAVCDATLARHLGASPVRGLVVATTGNGTLHQDLEAALQRAQSQGVRVLLATRCAEGGLAARTRDGAVFSTTDLSPVKARLSLMLELLGVR